MSSRTPRTYQEHDIEGRKLTCPICAHQRWDVRQPSLRVSWTGWFNWRLAAFTCERCGHVLLFAPSER